MKYIPIITRQWQLSAITVYTCTPSVCQKIIAVFAETRRSRSLVKVDIDYLADSGFVSQIVNI